MVIQFQKEYSHIYTNTRQTYKPLDTGCYMTKLSFNLLYYFSMLIECCSM